MLTECHQLTVTALSSPVSLQLVGLLSYVSGTTVQALSSVLHTLWDAVPLQALTPNVLPV
jgi:hypothetical protein